MNHMHSKSLSTGGCGLLMFCLFSLPQQVYATGQPSLVVDEPKFNFGKVNGGTTLSHTFLIRNSGDSELKITKVNPSCGCTLAELSESTLQPGSEATLTVDLKLDTSWNGRVRKVIALESNDPKTPTLTLVLEGESSSALLVKPSGVFFGLLSGGSRAEKMIELTAAQEAIDFKVLEAASESPYLEVKTEIVEEGKSYRVHISTTGKLDEGDLRAQVLIKTDQPSYETITIPVTATVTGALAISPREIVLIKRGDQAVTRYVVVAPGDVEEFKVETAEAPLDSIDVQVQPVGKSGYRIRLANLVATDDLDGKVLRITTNTDQKKEILIPIRVTSESPIADSQPKPVDNIP